ncbi:MAG: dipeptide epimerase [Armatimonadota bacterium]
MDIRIYAVDLPLKDPFETAKGRKTLSPCVVVEADGGFGSATPVKYVTGEDVDSVLAGVEGPSARAAWEIAALDARCVREGVPMCRYFGGARESVETDITIPITDPANARRLAERAAGMGFRVLKIKVGLDPEADAARVRAAGILPVRLDANQGFSPEEAVRFVEGLSDVTIDMLEQPVDRDDIEGLRFVRERAGVPVFADESAMTPADVARLIEAEAVDGVNVKLMKSGVSGALRIIELCRAARLSLMLGCMIELGPSLSTAVHLACGTGAFSRLDLDAHLLAAEAPFSYGFTAAGPTLTPSLTPGHGSRPLRR